MQFLNHFSRHRDGAWTCISAVTFDGPSGRVQVAAGSRFYPGTIFMGFDLAEWLEARYVEVEEKLAEREGFEPSIPV